MSDELKPRAPRIAVGTALIAVGAILLADRLDLADIGALKPLWPLILVGVGLAKLVQTWGTTDAGSGGWVTFAGLWLLAVNLNFAGMTYRNSWPVWLLAAGAAMVFRSFVERRPARGPGGVS